LNQFDITFKKFAGNVVLIEWPARIDELILEDIISLQQQLESSLGDFIEETINAYNSLTIITKADSISDDNLERKIWELYQSKKSNPTPKKVWRLPVCYDKELGIDLLEVAESKNLTIQQVIHLHCEPEYVVYFTGFLPGFLYLGGLPEILHTPRKAKPRVRIAKGAVAIGGQQTGVYPSESPGGWNIIGNCPLQFFNPSDHPPCFAQAGDHLKFYSISKGEFEIIKEQVHHGIFKIECRIK